MNRIVLVIVSVVLLVFGSIAVGQTQDAIKSGAADVEKGWQALDIPLLEKSLTSFEEMAKKNPTLNLGQTGGQTPVPISENIDISRFDGPLRETLG